MNRRRARIKTIMLKSSHFKTHRDKIVLLITEERGKKSKKKKKKDKTSIKGGGKFIKNVTSVR